jgi:hypothetical protein
LSAALARSQAAAALDGGELAQRNPELAFGGPALLARCLELAPGVLALLAGGGEVQPRGLALAPHAFELAAERVPLEAEGLKLGPELADARRESGIRPGSRAWRRGLQALDLARDLVFEPRGSALELAKHRLDPRRGRAQQARPHGRPGEY